jgi:hypothetical protein
VTKFLLLSTPIPSLSSCARRLVAHNALRLSCNQSAYQQLWEEILGNAWREAGSQFSWPVFESDNDRWKARAAIEAVVAGAYNVSRSQYEHILASFGHRAFPSAAFICLQLFDELNAIGIDEFSCKHDPYWDVPLNENKPEPVIKLAIPGQAGTRLGPLFDGISAESMEQDQAPTRASASTAVLPTRPRVTAAPSISTNGSFTRIAELLRSRGVITSSDAQQATGLNATGVRPNLQQLVQQGLAVTEGQRRGMRYRRVDG